MGAVRELEPLAGTRQQQRVLTYHVPPAQREDAELIRGARTRLTGAPVNDVGGRLEPHVVVHHEEPVGARVGLVLAGAVALLGFRDNPFALMRQADAFVLSSRYEGSPNSLIEAQGLGLPAVATDCPHGPREIVAHGGTGFLVPTDDAPAMAQAILQLLADRQTLARMGAEAKRLARHKFAALPLVRRWEAAMLDCYNDRRDDRATAATP